MATIVAGVALVAGTTGCGRITERAVEEAVEQNSDCKNVDVNVEEGGFSGDCAGGGIDVSAKGNAEVPADWPAELAPPADIKISGSTDTPGPPRTLAVVGGLEGDGPTLVATIKDQITAAGMEIVNETELPGGATITASGTEWELNVSVTTTGAEAVNGSLAVNYILTAAT